MTQALTTTQLLAAATEVLTTSGYARAFVSPDGTQGARTSRIFEDAYGIVAIHVFDTWTQLTEQWHVAQGELVDLISDHLRRPEPKAWEGYLVLLTPGLLPATDRATISQVRSDTSRVRKLVATGDDLGTLDEVRGTLLPLLPLTIDNPMPPQSGLLELLPELLSESGIPQDVTEVVVGAFVANDSIVERLHFTRSSR